MVTSYVSGGRLPSPDHVPRMEALPQNEEDNENEQAQEERDALGRLRREYFPRVHPFIRYTGKKFQARYRLTKELAGALADFYGESEYAPWGMPMGGGLSHRDRVSKKTSKFRQKLESMIGNIKKSQ